MTKFILMTLTFLGSASFGAVSCHSDEATQKKFEQYLKLDFQIVSNTVLKDITLSLRNEQTGDFNKVVAKSEVTADAKKSSGKNVFDISENSSDKYQVLLPARIVGVADLSKVEVKIAFAKGKPDYLQMDCP